MKVAVLPVLNFGVQLQKRSLVELWGGLFKEQPQSSVRFALVLGSCYRLMFYCPKSVPSVHTSDIILAAHCPGIQRLHT